jgi:hypothetical protein
VQDDHPFAPADLIDEIARRTRRDWELVEGPREPSRYCPILATLHTIAAMGLALRPDSEGHIPDPAALVVVERPGEPYPAYRAFTDPDKARACYQSMLYAGHDVRYVALGTGRWEWCD